MGRYFLLVMTLLLLDKALPSQTTAPTNPIVASVIQLVATPERFDGKLISVVGFLRLQHEGNLLYLSKDDYDNVILANSLWVDSTEEMGKTEKNWH